MFRIKNVLPNFLGQLIRAGGGSPLIYGTQKFRKNQNLAFLTEDAPFYESEATANLYRNNFVQVLFYFSIE